MPIRSVQSEALASERFAPSQLSGQIAIAEN